MSNRTSFLLENPIIDTDSYKSSHYLQYPPGTSSIYSYIEARSNHVFKEVPFIGLNYELKRMIENPITKEHVDEAEEYFMNQTGCFNRSGWDKVVKEYGGMPPLDIRAVQEGTVMPIRAVCMDVENTDKSYDMSMTSYFETRLLRGTWYASSVAAITREVLKVYAAAMAKSSALVGPDYDLAMAFALNDFGSRGCSSKETCAIGGFGHLTGSMGTDNNLAVALARDYYGESIAGYSIPASEHSTVTCWPEELGGETGALRNHILNFGSKEKNPTGKYAFVSDSTDIYAFVTNVIGGELKELILEQDNTLVVRPDSGEPTVVVPNVLDILWDKFGGTVNGKGFRVLNSKVRVIQGDGMSLESIPGFLDSIMEAGYSVENVCMGMGGGLLQGILRDDAGWAMKASQIVINGKTFDFCKNPKTDPGKVSKKGRFATVRNANSEIVTIQSSDLMEGQEDILVPTYSAGTLLQDPSLAEIRARCAV